jgi:phosphoribosylaminoimidazolecarboxamide formyltransferase/IMP cyclohydrolase/phosphoribosylaminoimidazolecarboxamide formyltransferase
MTTEIELKYGCNPNQKPARVYVNESKLPCRGSFGRPGYINLLDALNSWQLVSELSKCYRAAGRRPSIKHVSPAGARWCCPWTTYSKGSILSRSMELSPMASAYARARGADRCPLTVTGRRFQAYATSRREYTV